MTTPVLAFVRAAPVFVVLATCAPGFVGGALAQTPPSDLTQLSLAQLLTVDLGRPRRAWQFDYRFIDVHFEGYREGSRSVGLEEVLFRPGEPRTGHNFPVVPTRMVQRVHVLDVSHELSPLWRVSARLPFVQQRTHHVSVVPGYDAFSIETGGLSDVSLLLSRQAQSLPTRNVSFTLGLTLPTGSINQVGDTPRGDGLEVVPYTMQLGSGTVDVLSGVSYSGRRAEQTRLGLLTWAFSSHGRVRLGANDRQYRLGHQLVTDGQVGARPWSRLWPSVGVSWQWSGQISGSDHSLMVPGPFPYPAPVANPTLYGGTHVSLRLGLEVPVVTTRGSREARSAVTLNAARRVYAWLHGPQPPENWRLIAGWRLSL